MNKAPQILVVDDEPKICHLLDELLSQEGYQVDTCLSGDEALALVDCTPYDAVVVDLKMPGINGYQLIQVIKNTRPDTATIMVTAYATAETAIQALRHGADDYVTKPFRVEEMRRVVRRALDGQRQSIENRDLIYRLKEANQELTRRKRELKYEVVKTGESLVEANKRLEKRIHQLGAIQEISKQITSLLDLDRVLYSFLELINQKMGVRMSSVMLLETDGETLVVQASHGAYQHPILGERRRIGEGIAGWVAEYKEPLVVEDIQQHPLFAREERPGYEGKSLMCVPLLVKGQLLGVVNVSDKVHEISFTDEDCEFLTTVAGQLAVAIENARLYHQIQISSFSTVEALADSLDAKDPFTNGHSVRVTELALQMGRELCLSKSSLQTLEYAGRLHDIGKIGISESILNKPGPLTEKEYAVVRDHSEKGERIIQSLGFLERAKGLVRGHHERWDGRGYPDGLKEDQIPFLTRILMVADSYEAMTTERPYRPAKPADEAFAELQACAGSQFDPEMVDIFQRLPIEEAIPKAESPHPHEP